MTEIKRVSALVTGAGKRIGRQIALDLAQHGWCVCVHYFHSKEEADEVVMQIERRGGRAVAVQANLARESDMENLIHTATDELGPLSLLVNNASVFKPDEIDNVTAEGWNRHMTVNLRAPFRLSQLFANQVPKNETGNIINLIDQRVWNLTPHFMSYTISKAALWTATQTLALTLAPKVRVNAIGPGPILPGPGLDEEALKIRSNSLPLEEAGSVEEICRTVRYLLETPHVTGQMIALDGGEHLGWRHPKKRPDDIE